jgi:hypothetical protein
MAGLAGAVTNVPAGVALAAAGAVGAREGDGVGDGRGGMQAAMATDASRRAAS